MNMIQPRCAAAIACTLLTSACMINPITHRRQLVFASEAAEREGLAYYRQALKDHPLVTDPRVVGPVRRVAARLIQAASAPGYPYADVAQRFAWEVNVVSSTEINAVCYSGGKIVVYTGILPHVQNENGLAIVLGHEMSHALAQHQAEKEAQQTVTNSFVLLGQLAVFLGSRGTDPNTAAQNAAAVGTLAGTAMEYGLLLPYNRAQESEADHMGLLLAAQAGYDPREAVPLWERMTRAFGPGRAAFLSTHPSNDTRIRQLQGWMDEAMALYRPPHDSAPSMAPPANDTAWLGVKVQNVQAGTGSRAQIVEVMPGSPAAAGGMRPGDVIRALGGRSITRIQDFVEAVRTLTPGSRVQLDLERSGERMRRTVTLGQSRAVAAVGR